jgi:hypothetical protein
MISPSTAGLTDLEWVSWDGCNWWFISII